MTHSLTWDQLLKYGASLPHHLRNEPLLVLIQDHYGDALAYPLRLRENSSAEGERYLATDSEDYRLVDADDIEPGVVGLRPVAPGLPLLTFSYADEPAARDQELTLWPRLPSAPPA